MTSRYLGGGISAESAEMFRYLDEARRAERAAERARECAAWQAERDVLAEDERRAIEADAAYGELAEAAMLAAGYHRPGRGRWRRRRRAMTTDIAGPKSDPPPMTGPEMAELLDRIDRSEGEEATGLKERLHRGTEQLLRKAKGGDERALPALRAVLARRPNYFGKLGFADFTFKAAAMAAGGSKDVLVRELFIKELEAMARDLAGPDPSPLEVLLCQRVALAHYENLYVDTMSYEAELNGTSVAKAEFLSRQRNRATARFLASAKALATVRRLALPSLTVHLDASCSSPPGISADPPQSPAPRLRIGS